MSTRLQVAQRRRLRAISVRSTTMCTDIRFTHVWKSANGLWNPDYGGRVTHGRACCLQVQPETANSKGLHVMSCSAIQLPATDYPLWDAFPKGLVEDGKLSQLQLEGVLCACAKHQTFLPSGQRAFFSSLPNLKDSVSVALWLDLEWLFGLVGFQLGKRPEEITTCAPAKPFPNAKLILRM